MSQLFISYSSRDIKFARHLKRLLEEANFTVWIDESRLTTSKRWWTTIERTIEASAAVIVVMSPNSRTSDWVERELLYAEKLRKPVFPILLAGDEWPRLANIHYADMRAGTHAQLPPAFIRGLRAVVNPPSSHATLPLTVTPMLAADVHRADTIMRRRFPREWNRTTIIAAGIVVLAICVALVFAGLNESLALDAGDLFGSTSDLAHVPATAAKNLSVLGNLEQKPTMRLIYNDDAVLLVNISDQVIDASQLVFEQIQGDAIRRWQANQWSQVNVAVRPAEMSAGGCYQLIAYSGAQISPDRAVCAWMLGWFRSAQESRYFWLAADPNAEFTVRLLGQDNPLATCEVGAGVCEFSIPTPQ